MLKRLATVLLFGGLLGLVPASAQAVPVTPSEAVQPDVSPAAGYALMHKDRDGDHYRRMYRCDRGKRHYKKGDGRYHRNTAGNTANATAGTRLVAVVTTATTATTEGE